MWPFNRKEKRKNEDGSLCLTQTEKDTIRDFVAGCNDYEVVKYEWDEATYRLDQYRVDFRVSVIFTVFYERNTDQATRKYTKIFDCYRKVEDHQGYLMLNPKIKEVTDLMVELTGYRNEYQPNPPDPDIVPIKHVGL